MCTRRDPRTHKRVRAARNKGELSTMDLITKSGTISWEPVGNSDLRNSLDCYGASYECFQTLRIATRDRTWDL